MDPTNSNPTNSPAPVPSPVPGPNPQPDFSTQAPGSIQPTPQNIDNLQPVPRQPQPAQPVQPVPPVAAGGVAGVPGAVQAPVMPTPVNPVITPGATPVGHGGVGATEAILRPDPAPQPDPVEEELKAPMQAAAPAPGSIGSAVSGPAESSAGQTPSVSFNDPANQPDTPAAPGLAQSKLANGGQKSNRTTLIILIAVAGIIVVALVVVLLMQLGIFDNQAPSSGSSSNNSSSVNTNTDSDATDSTTQDTPADIPSSDTSVTTVSALSCVRAMTAAELVDFGNAKSGTTKINAEFDDNGKLSKVAMVKTIERGSDGITEDMPEDIAAEEALAADLTATSALTYNLPVGEDGSVSLDFMDVRANYESLDFICEEL